MKKINLVIFITGLMFTALSALELPALFVDHMVLQQNTSVKIWGTAAAGSNISIEASWGEQSSAMADKDGKWLCDLKTPAAGGPYTVAITDADSIVKINDVLIGEVWFCSGQSNMEMPLMGFPPNDIIDNYKQEAAQADYPEIRMFTVARHASLFAVDDVRGSWRVCDPQSVMSFSATAYFFARTLYNELHIPVGLLHSSWGGTPAQAWMSEKYLQKYPEYKAVIDKIDESLDNLAAQREWLSNLKQIFVDVRDNKDRWQELNFEDAGLEKAEFDDSQWKTMALPGLWETSVIGAFDGVVWFRKKVDLSAFKTTKDLIMELGPIDDMDITYLNGVEIGRHMQEGFYNIKRVYKIPADLLIDGINTLAIKVVDYGGGGGPFGQAEDMKIYSEENPQKTISLAGDWKYLPTAEYKNDHFYLFDIASQQFYQRPSVPVDSNPYNPTTLYNGMVHPVVPYTIKGTIWYQGEANTGKAQQYEELFPDLIRNWRDIWGLGDFPFYFVQIAPYDYGKDTPSYMLRDAQRKALKVKNTGMVVTLDIGNPHNIHPGDKQDVGKRLALWALAKDYGKDVVYSGPLYESIEIEGDKAVIHFKYTAKGLSAKEGVLKNFLIAGNDKEFKEAKAIVDGDKVIVSSPDIKKPLAVRYLWDNMSAASLFNSAGLPASSFRTDNW